MAKRFIERLKLWLHERKNQTLLVALLLMATIIAAVQWPREAPSTEQEESSADTYIPKGFVLVPIEIQNSDSLSALIGNYAVVDLFRGPNSQRVGKRLRLLRAPLNPQQFAVLVPEGEVGFLLQTPGPYWAAIQNPQQSKETEIENRKKKKSRVEYFGGS